MKISLIFNLTAEWLEINDLLSLRLLNKNISKKITENTFWKNRLIKKWHIPKELLKDPLWDHHSNIFHRMCVQIARCKKIDTFALPLSNPFSSTFQLAALVGAIDLLKSFIITGKAINNSEIQTALYYAAMSNCSVTFDWLMNIFDPRKWQGEEIPNLLLASATGGNLDIIKKVISLELFNINSYDSQDRNPIFLATLSNNTEALSFFLSQHHIYVESMSSLTKMNALQHAAENGSKDIFFLLANTNKFKFNDIDCNSRNVLHHAYRGGCKDIIDYIEDKKLNLNNIDRFSFLPKDYADKSKKILIRRSAFWKEKKSIPSQTIDNGDKNQPHY